jgi:hypothetical protein
MAQRDLRSPLKIRIAITAEAFEAIDATLPADSLAVPDR